MFMEEILFELNPECRVGLHESDGKGSIFETENSMSKVAEPQSIPVV